MSVWMDNDVCSMCFTFDDMTDDVSVKVRPSMKLSDLMLCFCGLRVMEGWMGVRLIARVALVALANMLAAATSGECKSGT